MIKNLCDICKTPCEYPDEYWHRVEDCAERRIQSLLDTIQYALKIGDRQHGDDYSYDDCWSKMESIIKDLK